jgi:hypothetical protein
VPLLFVPVSRYGKDRGHALEAAMEETIPELADPFAKQDDGERAGWRPSLVFSPMFVEDGRRLLISNRKVAYLTRAEGNLLLGHSPASKQSLAKSTEALGKYFNAQGPDASPRQPRQRYDPNRPDHDVYSRSSVELFRLFPEAQSRFHVSTAVRMNASFPYLSPAVELPTVPSRSVVDAGYYDNYGVNLAARWIYHWREWLAKNVEGVVLIQIRDSAGEYRRRHLFFGDDEPTSLAGLRIRVGLSWLTSPPNGASAARGSVMSFRNDEQLAALSTHFASSQTKAGPPFFTTVVFERPGEVGMTWYLSQEDKQIILNGFDEGEQARANLEQLERLKEWWTGQLPRPKERALDLRPR